MGLERTIKYPFTTLTDGEYHYSRPGLARQLVDVEIRGGQYFIRFPNNASPVKITALPFDARFTKSIT